MQALPAGFSRLGLAEVGSTNTHALDHAGQDIADRTWIVADRQTEGRGRHDRQWLSPPGNLYATLLLIDPCKVALSPRLGFVAGVALADAVGMLAPDIACALKWPNDLMARAGTHESYAKLSGILLEGRMLADGRQAVAIGIGVNIVDAPLIEGRAVASLAALGAAVDRDRVFGALAMAFARWLAAFAHGEGFAAIRAAWMERALPHGAALTINLPNGAQSGRFAGIDATGRLLLDTGQGMVHVDAGDVFLTEGP